MSNHTPENDKFKVCKDCGQTLPATKDNFTPCRYKSGKVYWSSYCRPCAARRTKAWMERNPERVKAQSKVWYQAHKDHHQASGRAWADANRDKARAISLKSKWKHIEARRATSRRWSAANRNRQYERDRQLRADHPEQVRARDRARYLRHRDGSLSRTRNYRARKRSAQGSHTALDVRAQYLSQDGRCWWCKAHVGDLYHVDHLIPLARGGSNGAENIVISCPSCNTSRRDKLPGEWSPR